MAGILGSSGGGGLPPEEAARGHHSLLSTWPDLEAREDARRITPGDPFVLDPNFRADARLTTYFTRSTFAHLAAETKRNYVNDCCVFFNFLWHQGKYWSDASTEDLLDVQHWRRYSPRNPDRIGGAKWNRELAAPKRLYEWAVKQHYMQVSPVRMREVMSRRGEMISIPAPFLGISSAVAGAGRIDRQRRGAVPMRNLGSAGLAVWVTVR